MRSRTACLVCVALAVAVGCPLDPLTPPNGSGHGGDGGADATDCTEDEACNDGNPCTVDNCVEGRCTSKAHLPNTSCDDGNLCNGIDACDALGDCQQGQPKAIDDGNPCTLDACDPSTGEVTHEGLPSCASWEATPLNGAPTARSRHAAVWTGSKMIIWGGLVSGSPSVTATGGLYDPNSKTWSSMSMTNAPTPRHSPVASWTGTQVLVWGGYGTTDYETTGALYDPMTNSWTPMTTNLAPVGRTELSMVWTGTALVVWGGLVSGPPPMAVQSGGVYDVALDSWSATSLAGAASQRFGHSGVWANDRLIVWGGNDFFDWHQDGKSYDPATNSWLSATAITSAPERREQHTAVWTGSEMLIWGGWNGGSYLASGSMFDPSISPVGQWSATTEVNAPIGRARHAWVWTGTRLVIWGGCNGAGCTTLLGDGGIFTPDSMGGSWTPIVEQSSMLARKYASAVWTGTRMIVWGGQDENGPTNTGGEISP